MRSLYLEPERARASSPGGALEFHDVFKIYRSGPVETVALRGLDLRIEPRRAGRGARAVGLAARARAASRGRPRRALGRRGARRSAARSPRLDERRARRLPRARGRDRLPERQPLAGAVARARTSRSRCGSPARRRRAVPPRDALAAFGLADRARTSARRALGGEQQRVAIAAAAARGRRSCSPTSRPASSTSGNERIVLEALARPARRVRQHRRRRHPLRAGRRGGRPRDRDARRTGGVTDVAAPRRARRLPRRQRRLRRRDGARARARGVDLAIAPGERVALVGPLGLGQDDAAARPRRPGRADAGDVSSGAASRSRRSTRPRAARARARGIAYVFQGANLLPHFTAFENVAFAAHASSGDGRSGSSRRSSCSSWSASAARSTPARRALRRRGAAGRDRPRARAAPAAAALRRADRPSRLRHRRARARPDRGAPARVRLRARRSPPTTPTSPRGSTARSSSPTARIVAERARRERRCAARRSPASSARPAGRCVRVARARRGGRAARRDAALRRPLAADDDRAARCAACRSTGRARSRSYRRRAAVAGSGRAAARRARRPRRARPRRSPAVSTAAAPGTIRAGSGAVLAVPPGYPSHIHTFRFLRGSLRPGEVVLDQQLAATLQAQHRRHGRARRRARARGRSASGSAASRWSPRPTSLFQPLNPLLGPAPAQPPANVAIMPLATFARDARAAAAHDHARQPRRVGRARARRPACSGRCRRRSTRARSTGSPSARAHARRPDPQPRRALAARARCSSSTTSPTARHRGRRRALRRDALHHARGSRARSSRSGSPTWPRSAPSSATAATSRCCARAARRAATCSSLALVESVVHRRGRRRCSAPASRSPRCRCSSRGGGGSSSGRVSSRSASASRSPWPARSPPGSPRASRSCAAASARAGAAPGAHGTPLWQRLYLDVARARRQRPHLLADRAHRLLGGRQPRLEPDPLAVGLHVLRARAALDRRDAAARPAARAGAGLARCARGRRAAPRTGRGFLLASAGRRGAAINRGLLVVGLLLAFGVELGIFTATYDQQARVDAQLTLGADVVVTAPPGVVGDADLAARSRACRGVAGDDRGRPLLRLRRPRPPGHLRHRPGHARAGARRCATRTSSAGARAQVARRLRAHAGRDPRLQGDDHRLLAAASATC